MTVEIWKDILGYEGSYQISNLGNVKSLDRLVNRRNSTLFVKGRVLSKTITTQGYYKVNLSKNGVKKTKKVHRLVCSSFINNPNNVNIVNHMDGDKLNNRYDNLEWCTLSENSKHAFDNNLSTNPVARGSKNGNSKLKEDTVLEIKSRLASGEKALVISRCMRISSHYVYDIKYERTWGHLRLED